MSVPILQCYRNLFHGLAGLRTVNLRLQLSSTLFPAEADVAYVVMLPLSAHCFAGLVSLSDELAEGGSCGGITLKGGFCDAICVCQLYL